MFRKTLFTTFLCAIAGSFAIAGQEPLTFAGNEKTNGDSHIVLIAGDEEYRSEEALPQLAKVLSTRHGFKTTVLFSINDKGEIDPKALKSLDHPAVIDDADLLITSIRFREWPDEAMKHFDDAMERGVPLIGLRTSTHGFRYSKESTSPYAKYSFKDKNWKDGFGRQILGETWVSHHGKHNVQGTRAVIEDAQKDHPILKGVSDIFGKTDVYGAYPPEDVTVLLRGAVTESFEPNSKIIPEKDGKPMMPIVWTRVLTKASGDVQRVVTTTMGSSQDLESEDLRRVLVNSVFWGLGKTDQIPQRANVDIVGEYKPTHYGVGKHVKGIMPHDLK